MTRQNLVILVITFFLVAVTFFAVFYLPRVESSQANQEDGRAVESPARAIFAAFWATGLLAYGVVQVVGGSAVQGWVAIALGCLVAVAALLTWRRAHR
jgi:hypothetical protein